MPHVQFGTLLVSRSDTNREFHLYVVWGTIATFIAGLSAAMIGHLLGGQRPDQRAGPAIACFASNVGLTIFIVSITGDVEVLVPAFLIHIFPGPTIQVLYSSWTKRQNN